MDYLLSREFDADIAEMLYLARSVVVVVISLDHNFSVRTRRSF